MSHRETFPSGTFPPEVGYRESARMGTYGMVASHDHLSDYLRKRQVPRDQSGSHHPSVLQSKNTFFLSNASNLRQSLTMKPTSIVFLATATLVASSALPKDLTERQAPKCKIFQIFQSPDATSGGAPKFVGTPQCCCINEQCHVVDRVNGINTSANLNANLAGDFRIIDARSADKGKIGSNDIRGSTYTVGAQGGCTK